MGIKTSVPSSTRSLIFTSSSKHHDDSAYFVEKIVSAILDSSILLKGKCIRSPPLKSYWSTKALNPSIFKALSRWATKLWRSSAPRKLMNTLWCCDALFASVAMVELQGISFERWILKTWGNEFGWLWLKLNDTIIYVIVGWHTLNRFLKNWLQT